VAAAGPLRLGPPSISALVQIGGVAPLPGHHRADLCHDQRQHIAAGKAASSKRGDQRDKTVFAQAAFSSAKGAQRQFSTWALAVEFCKSAGPRPPMDCPRLPMSKRREASRTRLRPRRPHRWPRHYASLHNRCWFSWNAPSNDAREIGITIWKDQGVSPSKKICARVRRGASRTRQSR